MPTPAQQSSEGLLNILPYNATTQIHPPILGSPSLIPEPNTQVVMALGRQQGPKWAWESLVWEVKTPLISEVSCLLGKGWFSFVWGFSGFAQSARGMGSVHHILCPAEILQCQHTAKLSTRKTGLPRRLLLWNIYCCADKTKLLAPEKIILQERRE